MISHIDSSCKEGKNSHKKGKKGRGKVESLPEGPRGNFGLVTMETKERFQSRADRDAVNISPKRSRIFRKSVEES